MRGHYTSVSLRRKFVITDPAVVGELQLGAVSDDGFIAWVNGHEVARYNMPDDELAFDATAAGAPPEPVPFETYVVSNPQAFVAGENVLAIQRQRSAGRAAIVDAVGAIIDDRARVEGSCRPALGANCLQSASARRCAAWRRRTCSSMAARQLRQSAPTSFFTPRWPCPGVAPPRHHDLRSGASKRAAVDRKWTPPPARR